MPDGDIIHTSLRGYYKPYKWLCEGKVTSDKCARLFMKALKQDIQKKGNVPVQLAQSMAEILDRTISAAGETGVVNWAALTVEFDRLVQQANGSHRLKGLILVAGKSLIHDLRYGQKLDSDSASEAIFQRYINTCYESDFKERVPLISTHHAGVEPATLLEKIEEIQPNINAVTSKWAKTAIKDQSIEKLRMPRRSPQEPVDLNEDLLGS